MAKPYPPNGHVPPVASVWVDISQDRVDNDQCLAKTPDNQVRHDAALIALFGGLFKIFAFKLFSIHHDVVHAQGTITRGGRLGVCHV